MFDTMPALPPNLPSGIAQYAHQQQLQARAQQTWDALDAEVQKGMRRWSPLQKRELVSIDQAKAYLMTEPGIPDETRRAELAKLEDRRRSLIPSRVPADEMPKSPSQQLDQNVMVDREGRWGAAGGTLVKDPKTGKWDHSRNAPNNQPDFEQKQGQQPGGQFGGDQLAMAPPPPISGLGQTIQSRYWRDPRSGVVMTLNQQGMPVAVPGYEQAVMQRQKAEQDQLRRQQEARQKEQERQRAEAEKRAAAIQSAYSKIRAAHETRVAPERSRTGQTMVTPEENESFWRQAEETVTRSAAMADPELLQRRESYGQALESEFAGISDEQLADLAAQWSAEMVKAKRLTPGQMTWLRKQARAAPGWQRAVEERARREGGAAWRPEVPKGFVSAMRFMPRAAKDVLGEMSTRDLVGFQRHAMYESPLNRAQYESREPRISYEQYLALREWAKSPGYWDDLRALQQTTATPAPQRQAGAPAQRMTRGGVPPLPADTSGLPRPTTEQQYRQLGPGWYWHPSGQWKYKR